MYFWRWATWKVFDSDPNANTGIVCFISVAGFLNGPGFERMRDYLRRKTDEIWVIDCSPEGHQPDVNSRIFEGVQQPVCIVLASRSPSTDSNSPATVRFRSLATGYRREKFDELAELTLETGGWLECPADWRAAFLPESGGAWSTYPMLTDLFAYNGSGVMPGRTWVIAPDADSLLKRWKALIDAPPERKEVLFHPHLRKGAPGDKHIHKVVPRSLSGFKPSSRSIANERDDHVQPVRYAFRSFDRQWIIPDSRAINQPNPDLWVIHSDHQIYLTALARTSPWSGPAITFTGLIPDLDQYNGRGGRVFPLWRSQSATVPNTHPEFYTYLSDTYGLPVSAEDVLAYIAAVAAHPAFTSRFKAELVQPGLRVPITSDNAIFARAAELGRTVIWLHTFGERFSDASHGRPPGPPRLRARLAPRIPVGGAIPQSPDLMPDTLDYDTTLERLLIGTGYVDGVSQKVWQYEVSGKQVLRQWFSYRKKNRERPIIGDRRPPSPLGDIQPDHWLAEYTTELLNVLNVLGRLVELEPLQAELLESICSGPTISVAELRAARALPEKSEGNGKAAAMTSELQPSLLD